MNKTFEYLDEELEVVDLYSRFGGPLSEKCLIEESRSKAAAWVTKRNTETFFNYHLNRFVNVAYESSSDWDTEVVHFRSWVDSKIGLPVSCPKESMIRNALHSILLFTAMEHRFSDSLGHKFFIPIAFELLREGYVLVGWKSKIEDDWKPRSYNDYNLGDAVIF